LTESASYQTNYKPGHKPDLVRKKSLFRKKSSWIIVIVGLVAALYSGIWLIIGQIIYNHVEAQLHQLNAQGQLIGGQLVNCENLRQSGYPLRIGLGCDKLHWQDRSNSFMMRTGRVVATAPVYAPSWRSVEITAPMQLEQEGFGSIEALWQELIIDADFVTGSPRDLDMRIEDLQLQFRAANSDPVHDRTSLSADFVHFRLNIMPNTDIKAQAPAAPSLPSSLHAPLSLHAKASFDALRLLLPASDTMGQLPAISSEIDFRLDNITAPPSQIESQPDWPEMLREKSGRVEKLDVHFLSGGGVRINGDFTISSTGKVSADLSLAVRQQTSLLRSLRSFLPHQSGNLESLFFALNAMPKNEQGEPLITINIDEGRVRAGFIPLGTLPPL